MRAYGFMQYIFAVVQNPQRMMVSLADACRNCWQGVHVRRQLLSGLGSATLLLLILVGPNGVFTSVSAFASPLPPHSGTGATPPRNQGQSNQIKQTMPIPSSVEKNRTPGKNNPHPGPITLRLPQQRMKPAILTLSSTSTIDFLGSDGNFEVQVPAGAIGPTDVTTIGGGSLSLKIEQTAGGSGSTTSGRIVLGTYRLTVLGAHGPIPFFTFHKPLTYLFHYQSADVSLIQPDHAFVIVIDGSALTNTALVSKGQTSWPSQESSTITVHQAHHSSANNTLSYTTNSTLVLSGTGTSSATFGTNAPVASWGTVQNFQADLNAGALSYGYAFDIPAGPNGIKPDLQLAYTSGAVNETENVQSSASWVGEGWNLALGSISWSQNDSNACCHTQSAGADFNNSWDLTTPDGISGQIVPPDIYDTTNGSFTATPLQWHSIPESHTKIIEITVNSYPCFRLWLPDGTLEEYGCTSDSRQYYVDGNGQQSTYRWDLDLIADTHGNQILVSYNQVKRNKPGTSYPEVVDATMQDVYYDWPSCQSTTTRCASGSALVNVHFDTSNKPAYFQGTSSSTCTGWTNTPGNDRCDNPGSPSGGLTAPEIHTVHVLNDVKVNVRPSSGGSFNLLRAYYFWYEQGPGATITDPATGINEGDAGYLDLTQVQQFGTDASDSGPSGTSSPPLSFTYTGAYQERYEDSGEPAYNVNNPNTPYCAPWYNYSGSHENLEVVQQEGSQLVNYWRDGNYVWHQGATFGDGIQSAPAVGIRSNNQVDVIVRRNGVLAYYWRNPQTGSWSGPETFGDSGTTAPSLAENSTGDLEVVVREGSQLAYYVRSQANNTWSSAPVLFGDTLTGDPAVAYNASNSHLEVIAFRNGQMAHYWASSTNSYSTWNSAGSFGDTGVTYTGLALAYNTGSVLPGYLEAVANENGQLVNYDRDSTGWHKGVAYDSGLTTGPAAVVYASGNLEVTAQKNGILQHDWMQANNTWHGPDQTFGDGNLALSAPGMATSPNVKCYYDLAPNMGQYAALWSQTQNQRYLASFNNGRGQLETFSWAEAHMNVWGGSDGQSTDNPLACTGFETTEPCYRADDRSWSRVILTRLDSSVQNAAGTTIDTVSRFTYHLTPVSSANYWMPVVSGEQGGAYTWSWGNVNSGDYLDYFSPDYRGFQHVTVDEWESHDGGKTGTWLTSTDHTYGTTSGWGIWDYGAMTSGNAPGCQNMWSPLCPTSPYWSAANALPGRELETDSYDVSGTTRTLLHVAKFGYNTVSSTDGQGNTWTSLDTCRPTGDPASPSDVKNPFTGVLYSGMTPPFWTNRENNQAMLVSDLNYLGNPAGVCDPRLVSTDSYAVDGTTNDPTTLAACTTSAPTSIPCKHEQYSYDTGQGYSSTYDFGNVTVDQISGNDLNGQVIVKMTDYAPNNNVYTTASSATGTYIVDAVWRKTVRDTSTTGAVHAYALNYFDNYTVVETMGKYGEVTQTKTAYQNTSGSYSYLTQQSLYDDAATGNAVAVLKPNGQTGACTISQVGYSICATYDTGAYAAHLTTVTNALGQATTNGYAAICTFTCTSEVGSGYDQWLTSMTDANGQRTTFGYDALGRLVSITKPLSDPHGLQGTMLPSTTYQYVSTCQSTSPQPPCIALVTTTEETSANSITSRTFEDGNGHTVETESPAPGGTGTLVSFTLYDALGRKAFISAPYTVSATTTYSAPNMTTPGTQYAYDALGRTISTQLVPHYNGIPTNTTTTAYQLTCSAAVGDSNCYEQAVTIDPNGHRGDVDANALGQNVYQVRYTGTGGSSTPYAVYTTDKTSYDVLGNVLSITHPDGTHATSSTYDLAGRKLSESDPNRGTTTYQYDSDGNITLQQDARAANGTVYAGYDALDRPSWHNTSNSPTGAYETFSYDSTTNGSGIGRLTSESYTSNGVTGSSTLYYDGRGRTTRTDQTVNGATYTVQQSYNYADQPVTTTYPDTEQVTTDYTSAGAPQDLQVNPSLSNTTFVVSSVSYATTGKTAALSFGGSPTTPIFTENLTYDAYLHPTEESATLQGASSPFFDLKMGYDQAYNVTGLTASIPAVGTNPAGSEQQSFCYDELNRLVWAGTTGTPAGPAAGTCGAAPGTDTLSGGSYTASYAYDPFNRMTTGPAGSYTYGAASHIDAVTSTSNNYTASYDDAGNIRCRYTTSANSCSGTDQTMTFDNEGRLTHWQNLASMPTQQESWAYDSGGARVYQQSISSSATTTHLYVGQLADYKTVVSGTSGVADYSGHYDNLAFAGQLVATFDTALHYLIADQLGSPTIQVGATGSVELVSLFSPYGSSLRYGNPSVFRSYAGQGFDDYAGLNYDNARWYDSSVGQFISADTQMDGLNRYAYVHGNPETLTDPTGHRYTCPNGCGGGGGGGSPPDDPPPSCVLDPNAPNCQTPTPPANCQDEPWQAGCGNRNGGDGGNDNGCGPTVHCFQSTGWGSDCLAYTHCDPGSEPPECTKKMYCTSGNNSSGFTSLLSGDDDAQGATQLIGKGQEGLLWLIQELKNIKGAVDQFLNHAMSRSGALATFLSILAALGCGVFCASFAALSASNIGRLSIEESQIEDGLDTLIGHLQTVENKYKNGDITQTQMDNSVFVVTEQGSYSWEEGEWLTASQYSPQP